ncbi:MAG TPA: carotenoid biosynthesis protein [Mucilaginibacter sp.]|jgi:putative membrane protein|nr:carotenoid biosynthesis protein [Mucilaginibacter sp.]
MERQENLRLPGLHQQAEELSINRKAISVIVIFHLIGLIGLSISFTHPIFLKLVPWHLLLMLAVIVLNHNRIDNRFVLFLVIVFISGFAAEWAGVHKHLFFGDYTYGKTLGVKVLGVPLIIGVNWFLLTYSASVLMQRSRLKSMFFRVIIGSLILVLLDLLIEPVAAHLDYWHWAGDAIPLKNYLSWFLASIVMLFIYELFRFKYQSVVAPVLLITQFIFFGILYLVQVIFLP